MRVRCFALLGLCCVLAQALSPAGAQPRPVTGGAYMPCRWAAEQAESLAHLPSGIMLAIGRVESGRPNPLGTDIEPWPWTINQNGEAHYFDTAGDAIAWTTAQLATGRRSIDVGCFQVNLLHHPHAFVSLESAFDPAANAAFAATLLRRLYAASGSWMAAIALYHSSDPLQGQRYRQRVLAMWRGVASLPPAEDGIMPNDPVVVRLTLAALAVRVILPNWAARQLPAARLPLRNGLPRVFGPGD